MSDNKQLFEAVLDDLEKCDSVDYHLEKTSEGLLEITIPQENPVIYKETNVFGTEVERSQEGNTGMLFHTSRNVLNEFVELAREKVLAKEYNVSEKEIDFLRKEIVKEIWEISDREVIAIANFLGVGWDITHPDDDE